ncbi:hypothetical protein BGZ65_011100, partial [Modicella reniformis]
MSMHAAAIHYPGTSSSQSGITAFSLRRYRVTSGSIITVLWSCGLVRVDAFDMRIRLHPPSQSEGTPVVKVRRLENFETDETAWQRLTTWASVAGDLKVIGKN